MFSVKSRQNFRRSPSAIALTLRIGGALLFLVLFVSLAAAISLIPNQDQSIPSNDSPGIAITRITRTPTPTPTATAIVTFTVAPTATPTPTATYVPPTETPYPTRNISVRLDLDVDSDNSGDLDGTEAEDRIEEERPGKIILAHDLDTDYDGIPDYADGFVDAAALDGVTTFDGGQPGTSGAKFTLIKLSIEEDIGSIPDNATVTIWCGSNGADMIADDSLYFTPDNNGAGGWFSHRGEAFRLWAKDGDELRSARRFLDGGDLIECGKEIPIQRILDLNGKFYIEGLYQFSQRITANLNIPQRDSQGKIIVIEPASVLYDAIQVSGVKIEIGDVEGWRPTWKNSDGADHNYGDGKIVFHDQPSGHGVYPAYGGPIGGAITDGASLLLVTIRGWDYKFDEMLNRISMRMDPGQGIGRASSDTANLPSIFGGFRPAINRSGTVDFPALPMPRYSPTSAGWSRESMFTDGALFYLPPRNFITSTSVREAGFPSGNWLVDDQNAEVAKMDMKLHLQIGGQNTKTLIGTVPFRLRRPPLIVVHGLNGSGGSPYWSQDVWDEANPSLATRLYYVDYSASPNSSLNSALGYAENFSALPDKINEALDSYRFARDDTQIGGSAGRDRHIPERGFHRVRYAARRVDVAGHSMGGQLTRAFISDVNGVHNRQGTWPAMNFARGGRYNYFNTNNLGAGAIRRFIPIGSPFQGSPYATSLQNLIAPQSTSLEALIQFAAAEPATAGEILLQMGVVRRNSAGNWTAVDARGATAVADLTEHSPAQTLLENARYPTGDKAVLWFPIVGFAQLQRGPPPDGVTPFPDGAGSLWDLIQCGRLLSSGLPLGGAIAWFFEASAYPELLGANVSDFVVPSYSQRNVRVRSDSTDEERREGALIGSDNWKIGITIPKTVHSRSVLNASPLCALNGNSLLQEFGSRGIEAETTAAQIVQVAGDVLVASDTLAETGPTGLSPGGNGGLQSTGLGYPN